uniref:Uncharacterized protein n=1 Tax=Ananas comosus var. bracteatus TaxID=296719 RepID=A0A6V7PRX1_ANACO|nr:unnamed protein product [Ananas comosus var. bracteatus]
MLAVPVQGYSVPVQATRTDSAALGLAPVPVQEPVYRYKGVLVESPVGDFVADVAPRAVRARLLPELCEEAGRGSVFTVLDVALRFDAVEVVSDCWVLSELTVDPYRLFGVRLCREHVTCCLIELDRDTLHTRLGSAHECHSGVRLVLSRWCRSCQLDLLSTDQLVWIEPIVAAGQGRVYSQSRGRSHRCRLLHLPPIRIEARASRARALPDSQS